MESGLRGRFPLPLGFGWPPWCPQDSTVLTTDGLTSHLIGEEPEEQRSEATCLGSHRQSRRVLAASLMCFPLLYLFTSARREHEEL